MPIKPRTYFSRKNGVFGFLLVLALIEMVVRISGFADFPIYNRDDQIQYLPQPNQRGAFLDWNDWYFNDKSMPIPRNWDPDLRPNILLIGNSIVAGGDSFRQADKLSSQLQMHLGLRPVVWPLAAGRWRQPNEIAYLNRHPEIAGKVDYLVWEYMAGGLSRPTPWGGEYQFPTHRPICATCNVLRRYLLPVIIPSIFPGTPPITGRPDPKFAAEFKVELTTLSRNIDRSHPGLIWLYPTRAQFDTARRGQDWLPERRLIADIARTNGLRIIDIASDPTWSRTLYRGDGVHPTVEGTKVLGSILADEIGRDTHP
jgi:hypothetical protein